MATAVVEERQLLKSLRWWDGFTIALANPGFLLGSLLLAYGALGVVGAMVLWGISAAVGLMQNWIYSEPSTMFPGRSGGIALYANEGWRRYTTLVGPIATFGYWIGWSVVLAIFGELIGTLIQARWFASTTWTVWDGTVHLRSSNFIGIGAIIARVALQHLRRQAVHVVHVRHRRAADDPAGRVHLRAVYQRRLAQLERPLGAREHQWGGVKIAFVWLFLMGWSAYGIEVCATFTPEYKSRRDSTIALRSAATFSLLVFILLPLGLGGVTGVPPAAAQGQDRLRDGVPDDPRHSALASIMLIFVITSLLLSMATSTADAGRALYGISKAGLTIKQLGTLNRFNVPARAMTVDLVVNMLLILFISSLLAILYMSNIGYILCHVLALSGFLLLRKDRPNWPRPIKVAAPWVFDGRCSGGVQRGDPGRRRRRPQAQRLRHLDGLRDRRRHPRRLGAAVLLPAGGPGQGADPLEAAPSCSPITTPTIWGMPNGSGRRRARRVPVHPT